MAARLRGVSRLLHMSQLIFENIFDNFHWYFSWIFRHSIVLNVPGRENGPSISPSFLIVVIFSIIANCILWPWNNQFKQFFPFPSRFYFNNGRKFHCLIISNRCPSYSCICLSQSHLFFNIIMFIFYAIVFPLRFFELHNCTNELRKCC